MCFHPCRKEGQSAGLVVSNSKPNSPPLAGGGRGEGVLGGALYNLDDRISAAHGRQNYAVKAL